ncbi:MAG: hypothetical protein JNL02_14040 [Saprospiraceae bacterium]|nr:hypothetical protein [Saprospiraceae bacterium]
MNCIATWIYLDSPEESSEYPQVGQQSHLEKFQLTYWKCVAVFYALSTRLNPGCKHVLFSNKRLDEFPEIQGFDLKKQLYDARVEVVTLPLTWQTPPGYFGKWRNQFYIFDVLKFFEIHYHNDTDAFVVLDSDCIVNRPLDGLFSALQENPLMALTMPYDLSHNINGVTRKDMRSIFADLDKGVDPGHDPVYYGGEIFAATLPIVRRINKMVPAVWENMQSRFRQNLPKLNEEAHFLSYCYYKIGKLGALEPFIKRIWTAPHHNNVEQADILLPIWHLPSEKTGGLSLLFESLRKNPKVLNVPNEYLPDALGKFVGVPVRTKWLNLKHFLKYTPLYRWLKKR